MSGAESDRRIREYQAVTSADRRSTHDLVRDLLAYCAGVPVPFPSLYAAVNAKLPQERQALLAVLQAYPYFVPSNGNVEGPWSFDPGIHRKILTALAKGGSPEPPAPEPPVAPAPSPVLPEGSLRLPSPMRGAVKRLLAAKPVDVMRFLDHVKEDFWPNSSMPVLMKVALEMGWCSESKGRYKLTDAGHALAGLPTAGRAGAIRGQLRRLPSYAAAEDGWVAKGQLSGASLAAVLEELPAESRLDPGQILQWLGWMAGVGNDGRSAPAPEEAPADMAPTLEAIAGLLDYNPESAMHLLLYVRENGKVPASLSGGLRVALGMGWCGPKAGGRERYELTDTGERMVKMAPVERAEAVRQHLLRLPAYQAAEGALKARGELSFTSLDELILSLPAHLRPRTVRLFDWLSWTVNTRKLGQAADGKIRLTEEPLQKVPPPPVQATPPAPPRQPPASHVKLPPAGFTITREQVKGLLGVEPGKMMKLLDDISVDFWPVSSLKEALNVALGMGWCVQKRKNQLALTKSGEALVKLKPHERADAMQQQLRRLPAYQAAEELLFRQGELTADHLRAMIRALPTDYRLHEGRVYAWLSWAVVTAGLGAADAGQITIGADPPPEQASEPAPEPPPQPAPRLSRQQQAVVRREAEMKRAEALAFLPAISLSADRMQILAAIAPETVAEVLDRLREGWRLHGEFVTIARTLADLRWCVTSKAATYGLTAAGKELADLPDYARAHVFRSLFQRLPGYLVAVEWLKEEGRLTPEQARMLYGRMHRNSPAAESFYDWIRWIVVKLEFGQADSTQILLDPAARSRLR